MTLKEAPVKKEASLAKTQWIKSTCAYCGVGCGIEASVSTHSSGAPTISIRGDANHPANYGKLCSKGLALGDTIVDTGKLSSPSIDGQDSSWEQALNYVASGFLDTINQYGPDSVAFYVSGQLLTEDYYVANKLMKGFIGSANIDTNSRLCMSSSVAGHKRAFGTDTVPNCYADIELATLVILTGSNLAWCHPVLYQRLKAAKQANPLMKVVVIDPRATDTCDIADLHLAIEPGTDVALFNGLLNYLDEHGYCDEQYITQYTQGFDNALKAAQEDTGQQGVDYLQTARTTGIPITSLATFYRWFAENKKVLTCYSQGVNQSSAGSDKVNSIINCHLATGRIGKEGAGPFSLTGQPNAMGGREVGGLANMLAAHMEFDNQQDYQAISDFWGTTKLANTPGLKAVELFDAVAEGRIKAIWIMATNPVVSLPNANKIQQALEACPLVVVSDCIKETDTTRYANVLLPAKGWAEKSGTVTNSERRISRQRALIGSSNDTPNGAKSDWWIITQIAKKMGYTGFNFQSEADVFREHAQMTQLNNTANDARRDFDLGALTNISNQQYDDLSPQQWPLPPCSSMDNHETNHVHKRFFADGQFYTPNQLANFIAIQYRPPMSRVSQEYPIILNTGRIRDQWHTMTRTGLAPLLGGHKSEPYLQINPQDARCFNLEDGDIAELSNLWGSAKARVWLSPEMNPGQCFIPIHWSDTQSSNGKVCRLVSPNVDPISGQPEAKYTPVAIEPWHYASEAILLSHVRIDTSQFDYWIERIVSGGYIYRLAQAQTEDSHHSQHGLLDALQAITLQTKDGASIEFSDTQNHYYRQAVTLGTALKQLFIIAPSFKEHDVTWLDNLLVRPVDTEMQRSILKGTPTNALASGRQICACKQVGELNILRAIEEQQCKTAEAVGKSTAAGTGCGSCIPEINRMLADTLNSGANLANAV